MAPTGYVRPQVIELTESVLRRCLMPGKALQMRKREHRMPAMETPDLIQTPETGKSGGVEMAHPPLEFSMTFRRLGKGRAWWGSTLISIMVIYGMNELCISMNRPVALVEPGSVFHFFLVDIQGDGAPPVRESKSFNRYCKMLISNA